MGGPRLYDLGDLLRHGAKIGVRCPVHKTEQIFDPGPFAEKKSRAYPWKALRFTCLRCKEEGLPRQRPDMWAEVSERKPLKPMGD
jgi:hypothetical protein